MIEAALHRIEAGEYGECVSCGAEIDPERLDLVPATPFCATCAAKH
jgi:RNA polymerase-binding transcription factor DksA